jgi:hypothetical protein
MEGYTLCGLPLVKTFQEEKRCLALCLELFWFVGRMIHAVESRQQGKLEMVIFHEDTAILVAKSFSGASIFERICRFQLIAGKRVVGLLALMRFS